jgi:hypothetical protein
MPVKIYHPKRGYVLTNNNFEVDELLAEGGVIVKKNREAEPVPVPDPETVQEENLIGDVEPYKPEPAPAVTRKPAQRKSKLI